MIQLPGIGEGLANQIDGYRQVHGSIGNIDELRNVRGIGPATLERLRPWVIINEGGEQTPNEKGPKTDKLVAGSAPIDLNQASVAELQRLPGIGPKRAQQIVDERQRRPFESVAELRRVSGIGPKTLEKLRPFVCVSTDAGLTVRSSDR
jgi:competence protein ComEA